MINNNMGKTYTLKELKDQYIDIDLSKFDFKFSNTLSSFSLIGNYEGDANNLQNYLTSVTNIGSHVEKLDDYCFYNCKNLIQVNDLNYINRFGKYCFFGCDNLTCDFPQFKKENTPPIYSIGTKAFFGSNIEKLYLNLQGKNYPDDRYYYGSRLDDVHNGPFIGQYAFANSKKLTDVFMLKSCNLGAHMFEGCTALTSITFENDFGGNIGQYVFKNCTSLKSITLPAKIETISRGMFDSCISLTSINIPTSIPPSSNDNQSNNELSNIIEGLKLVDDYAFNETPNLKSIRFPKSLSSLSIMQQNSLFGSGLLSVYFDGVDDEELTKYFMLSSEEVEIEIPMTTTTTSTIINGVKYTPFTQKTVTQEKTKTGRYLTGTLYRNDDFQGVFDEAIEFGKPFIGWVTNNDTCGLSQIFNGKLSTFLSWIKDKPIYLAEYDCGGPDDPRRETTPRIFFNWYLDEGVFVWYTIYYNGRYVFMRSGCTQPMQIAASYNEYLGHLDFNQNKDSEKTNEQQNKFKAVVAEQTLIHTKKYHIQKRFDGFGIGHPCTFISNTGKKYYFIPTKSSINKYSLTETINLSTENIENLTYLKQQISSVNGDDVAINSSGSTLSKRKCNLTFTEGIFGRTICSYSDIPSGVSVKYYEPCVYNLSSGSHAYPIDSGTAMGGGAAYSSNMSFSSWNNSTSKILQYDETYSGSFSNYPYNVFFDNIGNIIQVKSSRKWTEKYPNGETEYLSSAPWDTGYNYPEFFSNGEPKPIKVYDENHTGILNTYRNISNSISSKGKPFFVGWVVLSHTANGYKTCISNNGITHRANGLKYAIIKKFDQTDYVKEINRKNPKFRCGLVRGAGCHDYLYIPIYSNYYGTYKNKKTGVYYIDKEKFINSQFNKNRIKLKKSEKAKEDFYNFWDISDDSFWFYGKNEDDTVNIEEKIAYYHLPFYPDFAKD